MKYIYIDGELSLMQLAERNLLNDIANYMYVLGIKKDIRNKVIVPFLNGSREGINIITNFIYDFNDSAQDNNITMGFDIKSIPSKLISSADNSDSIVSKYLKLVDNWYYEIITNSQCVLLIDQFIEETNKIILSKYDCSLGYIDVLDKIYKMYKVNEELYDSLKILHKIRNKIQHRGYKPDIGEINQIIEVGFNYLNSGLIEKLL